MPTIEVSHKDLCKLIGKKLSVEQLKDLMDYAKGEIEGVEGDILKIEMKDTNRPDLWSAEGLAREIRGRTKKAGMPKYKVSKSKVVVKVDKKVSKVRPLTVCAVVKGLRIDDDVLSQMVQLQEKTAVAFGRNRKEVAIGVYDLRKIKPPIKYTTVKPDGIKFMPLEFDKELTPREILKQHPKGKEFGHLLEGCKEYPMFIDSAGNVLSIPPIINSEYTGKVTKKTRDVFIECSGFDFKFLVPALNVIVTALAERGGRIQSVKVTYPNKKINTPDLSPKKTSVDVDYANKISGLNLSAKQMCKLLDEAGYKSKISGKRIGVTYPAYRQDIMHQRDLVEDIIISFGYNKIEPLVPRIVTTGSASERELFSKKVSQLMIGLGMQEILSYTLTNQESLFEKMNIKKEVTADVENPVSANWCVFRNWLLPGVVDFLSNNQHVEYPQKIFEIGDAVLIDEGKETKTRDVRKLACAIAHAKASYEEISSILDSLLRNLNVKYSLKTTEHNSFIKGRVAEVIVNKKTIGFVGEISPLVLSNWKLEMPVAALEIDLENI